MVQGHTSRRWAARRKTSAAYSLPREAECPARPGSGPAGRRSGPARVKPEGEGKRRARRDHQVRGGESSGQTPVPFELFAAGSDGLLSPSCAHFRVSYILYRYGTRYQYGLLNLNENDYSESYSSMIPNGFGSSAARSCLTSRARLLGVKTQNKDDADRRRHKYPLFSARVTSRRPEARRRGAEGSREPWTETRVIPSEAKSERQPRRLGFFCGRSPSWRSRDVFVALAALSLPGGRGKATGWVARRPPPNFLSVQRTEPPPFVWLIRVDPNCHGYH